VGQILHVFDWNDVFCLDDHHAIRCKEIEIVDSSFPTVLKIIGVLLLLVSFYFLFRSFKDNTFLSPLVRIQSERKQHLVTTGVYAIVRHPMYLGALLMFIGAPSLLGSWVGLALGFVMTIAVAFRALGEEKMLMKEFAKNECSILSKGVLADNVQSR